MKALALTPGTTKVELKDWDEPKIEKPNQVKLRIREVGICGTDREECSGGRADAPYGEKELIIGHEMFGEVVEVGSNVKSLKKGDYAVTTVRRSCGKCAACAVDAYDMCYTGEYTERGIKQRHGFQAEYVVDEETFVLKVPPSIISIGVLTEPMSVVEKAIDEASELQARRLPTTKEPKAWLKDKTVFVAGLGPIGLLAAVILRLRGARVLGMDVVDENSARPQILKELGGEYIDGRNLTPEQIHQKTPQIDLILEAAGIPKLDFDLLNALGINGIYVLTGVPKDAPPLNVDGAKIMRELVLKNQVIFGSVNAGFKHFKMGIEDLEAGLKKWPKTLPKIISNKVPITSFHEVIAKHTADEIKVVIDWNQFSS